MPYISATKTAIYVILRFAAIYLLIGALSAVSISAARHRLASASLNYVGQQLLAAAIIFSICMTALFMLHKLDARKTQAPPDIGPRFFKADIALMAICAAVTPLVFAYGAFATSAPIDTDLRWSLAIPSILVVGTLAFAEEVGYRKLLLEKWIDAPLNVYCGVALQALLFALAHGKFARISAHYFIWYLATGLLLGAVYARWRSLVFNTSLHAAINICIAQSEPLRDWYVGQLIPHMAFDWRVPHTYCQLAAFACVLLIGRGLSDQAPHKPARVVM